MDFKEYKYLLLSDLYRLNGKIGTLELLRNLVRGKRIYQYNFWMRTCRYSRYHSVMKFVLYPIAQLMLNRYRYRFLVSIDYNTDIGSGLYIGHFGSVFVNVGTKVGKNFNISQDVTVGIANRGRNKGCAIIGDNVYIGPGAKIIGSVRIGNNVAIGANCVVTKDIPDNAVVGGVPGKIISYEGSTDYVNFTDYDRLLR